MRLLAIDDANGPVKTVLKQPIVVVAEASYRGSMSSEKAVIYYANGLSNFTKPLPKTKACYIIPENLINRKFGRNFPKKFKVYY